MTHLSAALVSICLKFNAWVNASLARMAAQNAHGFMIHADFVLAKSPNKKIGVKTPV